MGHAGTRFAVLLLLLAKALYGMPDSADRNTCGIYVSGAEYPLLRNSDEEHDLAVLCESIGCLMPSCKDAKLMEKVFKGSVWHQELAARVEELEL